MPLFVVKNEQVELIHSQDFADESVLQQLFDANLEDITGVRFIESQYSIPNGRIDSLGIDEQNTPVVIEYKWGHDPAAIIQGLFYLNWVRENRRTFEMLVREKIGNVKVNWSSAPRLLIIAKQYSDKEVSAINMISALVELKRYSFYGNLLNVEDVISPKSTKPDRAFKGVIREDQEEKTVEDIVKRASPALKDLFFQLRDAIFELGDDVREKVGGWYSDYRKSSTFATINPQTKKKRLLVFIKMGDKKLVDPEKWAFPISGSWGYGKLNTQFEISEPSQVDYAMQLIRQAYHYVP